MTTSILGSAGRSFGSALTNVTGLDSLPFSQGISSRINSLTGSAFGRLGRSIDSEIFGVDDINYIRGPKLLDLNIQTSSYGETIPIIFGRVKIAGNIIWAKPIKEVATTTQVSSGGKGGDVRQTAKSETRFNYYATFALALCEGEVTTLDKFYANGKLINPSSYCTQYNVYKGTETQSADPIIETYEGAGNVTAYRGLCYIVFEDFNITEFGNRLPNFTFEVTRVNKNLNTNSAENLVKQITLIPGSGEFVYDTEIKTKTYGYDLAGKWIETRKRDVINMNNASGISDVKVALDNLAETFPNLEYVSVVVNWFASSLDIADCTFEPKVEYKEGTKVIPTEWSVAGKTRATASEVSRDENDNILYGGTPSDASVLNLITELKARGYNIMFYPMPLVDLEGKPWRGWITGDYTEVADFFNREGGYNEFILHYANLVEGEVDAFLIGSELKSITSINDGSGIYPAVDEFISLADQVKTIMGSATKISYAADWSEYHSQGGVYYMDKLWADGNIDFIGIDAYFPILDEPQDPSYSKQNAINGWESGEGYDWYYTDSERTTKASLGEAYAWKNIAWWWNNYHYNPGSVQTDWVPQSKKIWFTEYGFPAVDGALNQPNVFYNPEASDGGLPYHSKGYTDFLAQRLGIEATEEFWLDSEVVENKFLWAFDARPYPYWPELKEVWADGNVWAKGHWVNGKLGSAFVDDAITEIANRCGIASEKLETNNARQVLDGFVINNSNSAEKLIEYLQAAFLIDRIETSSKIKFQIKGKEKLIELSESDFAEMENFSEYKISEKAYSKIPTEIIFNYISKENSFLVSNQKSRIENSAYDTKLELSLPVVMNDITALNTAITSLSEEHARNRIINFTLPSQKAEIEVGDVTKFPDGKKYKVQIVKETEGRLEISATEYFENIYNVFDLGDFQNSNIDVLSKDDGNVLELLDIPTIEGDASDKPNLKIALAATEENFKGASIYYKLDSESEYKTLTNIEKQSIMGNLITELSSVTVGELDETNEPEVQLIYGELSSITESEFAQNKNLALLGDEIISFKNATLLEEGKYRIDTIKRGLFGTEQFINTHTQTDRFILLDDNITNIELPTSAINQTFDVKAVNYGHELISADEIEIDFAANNLKPLSPLNLEGEVQPNNDIIINWQRRTRQNSYISVLYVELPLAETEEKYVLEVLDGTDIAREVVIYTPEFTYTESMQLTDFGTLQTSYIIRVSQVSARVGKGFPAEVEITI